MKAIKNETEIQGFRNAYARDGAAMVYILLHFSLGHQLTKFVCQKGQMVIVARRAT